jgi:hypothetical protein
MLGLVIDGNRQPTIADVDDWIERKGSIEQAFDGVLAEEGAGRELLNINALFYFTKKVAFRLWRDKHYAWLIVVDRYKPSHSVCFRADSDQLRFSIHECRDESGNEDAVYDERVMLIRRAIESFAQIDHPPPVPQPHREPVLTRMAAFLFPHISDVPFKLKLHLGFCFLMIFVLGLHSEQVLGMDQHALRCIRTLVFMWMLVFSYLGYACFLLFLAFLKANHRRRQE